jgi:hypothetical protein
MLVAELRQRLAEKVGQAAASGDREDIANVLEYVRAVLIALAQHPEDEEFVLQDAAVDTRTAALILRLHPEHVRYLIRREKLPATKENGEFRIPLSDVAEFMVSGMSLPSTLTASMISELMEKGSFIFGNAPRKGRGQMWVLLCGGRTCVGPHAQGRCLTQGQTHGSAPTVGNDASYMTL